MKIQRLLLLVMAMCFASGVKAQIYNSEVLFFVNENSQLSNPQTNLRIMRIKNGRGQWVNHSNINLKAVCDNLKSNINYYETNSNIWGDYHSLDADRFDYEMSNTKWAVYSRHIKALWDYVPGELEWPAHTDYEAIAKDFSKYMLWSEPEYENRQYGHMGERVTFKRLTKSELVRLSFTGTRDFLQ